MTAKKDKINKAIEFNRKVHNNISEKYNTRHDDIFNTVEQNRIFELLSSLKSSFNKDKVSTLDFGCGTGNITKNLIKSNYHVVAADITENFLRHIREENKNKRLSTLLLSGNIVNDLESKTFDLICIYSVLHHLPEYLDDLKQLTKHVNLGGCIYIDHEASGSFWKKNSNYLLLQQETKKKRIIYNLSRKISFRWIYSKLMSIYNPKFQIDGDIHVWEDDHIEWDLIDSLMEKCGFQKEISYDYLNYKEFYSKEIYVKYKGLTSDMHCSVYRKLRNKN